MQEYMQNNHALGRSHAPVTVQSYCHIVIVIGGSLCYSVSSGNKMSLYVN